MMMLTLRSDTFLMPDCGLQDVSGYSITLTTIKVNEGGSVSKILPRSGCGMDSAEAQTESGRDR